LARIEFATEVAGDLDRIVDHLTQHDASRVDERISGLIDAIDLLTHSPLVGRPVRHDLVRSQREAGYANRDDVDS
jgi:toxin ParE1/3/4